MSFIATLLRHKTVEQLQAEAGARHDFRRVLGVWQLTAIGIGGIIGVGVFVLAGQQAALNAGPAVALSFMSESRRVVNRRMKEELGVALRYPTVREGVPLSVAPAGAAVARRR